MTKKIIALAILASVIISIFLSSCDRAADDHIENEFEQDDTIQDFEAERMHFDELLFEDLYYIEKNDEITITGYAGKDEAVIIPSVIDEKEVTHIASEAFSREKAIHFDEPITHISIPETVTKIDDDAFVGYTELESIEVDVHNTHYSSLNGALYNKAQTTLILCPRTTTGRFEIPDGVTHIHRNAFNDCTRIEEISIPSSVETIDEGAFQMCTELNKINLSDDNEHFTINDGGLYDDAMSKLYLYYDNSTRHLYVPESITHISDYAFISTQLISIELPEDTEHIGQGAFLYSPRLFEISMRADNDHFSSEDGVLYNNDQSTLIAFPANYEDQFDVPSSVKIIEPYAFAWSALQSVTLPEGLTHIHDNAFMWNYYLLDITLPRSLTYLGDRAFYECIALEKVNVFGDLEYIGNHAFQLCRSLTEITFFGQLNTLGDYAFASCFELKEIEIPEGVTQIAPYTFYRALTLEKIILPDGLEQIGQNAFLYCFELSNINIPESIKYLGEGAFSHCQSLTEINIPQGVTTIRDLSFYRCLNLSSIQLPKSILFIEESAFEYCQSLKSVDLPENLRYIGSNAFANCNYLKVSLPDKLIYIGPEAFRNGQSLLNITIPHGIQTIEAYTFAGCFNLIEVDLPDHVTHIEENAFNGCTNFSTITLSENIIHIGDDAFDQCPNLIITCSENTYAHSYAIENDIEFELI